ncbi:MAG: hypothetical protein U5K54_03955 [Cytophagales bacterium]|nr:hypothetical protein [Cytophagales bacterium]
MMLWGLMTGIKRKNRFDINVTIDRLNKRTLNLAGYYLPSESKSPLQLTAKLDETNIKLIEPFLKGIFSQMDGDFIGLYENQRNFHPNL